MERACPVCSCVPQCAAPAPHWGLSFAVVARLSLAVHFTLAGPEALTAFKHRVTDAVTRGQRRAHLVETGDPVSAAFTSRNEFSTHTEVEKAGNSQKTMRTAPRWAPAYVQLQVLSASETNLPEAMPPAFPSVAPRDAHPASHVLLLDGPGDVMLPLTRPDARCVTVFTAAAVRKGLVTWLLDGPGDVMLPLTRPDARCVTVFTLTLSLASCPREPHLLLLTQPQSCPLTMRPRRKAAIVMTSPGLTAGRGSPRAPGLSASSTPTPFLN
ncbi:hypothetical protein CB1_000357017 [Camelus ferus]|nr:hypothetical protein CB1_000357017 [Camelus ferus]